MKTGRECDSRLSCDWFVQLSIKDEWIQTLSFLWKCQGWWRRDGAAKGLRQNLSTVHLHVNSSFKAAAFHWFPSSNQFSPSNNLLSCLHVSTVDAVRQGVTNKASCVCFHPNELLLASLTWKPCGLGAPLTFSCALKERLMCNQNHGGAVFGSPSGQGLCGDSGKKSCKEFFCFCVKPPLCPEITTNPSVDFDEKWQNPFLSVFAVV